MKLFIGTGGYTNTDWLGLIYPEGSKQGDFLAIYSRYFNAVEVNSSFYAIPGEKAFGGMLKKTEGLTRFTVKLNKIFTHERSYTGDDVQRMILSPKPLREAGVLGPFLAQFPYSFKRTPETRKYLQHLVTAFEGQQIAVEFRHASWLKDEVLEAFTDLGLIWVSADYPPMDGLPPYQVQASTDTVYIRLHGRNQETWWEGQSASDRHDYRYSEDEIQDIADQIAAQKKVEVLYLFFQNTTKGHALFNYQTLKDALKQHGLEVDIPKGSGLF